MVGISLTGHQMVGLTLALLVPSNIPYFLKFTRIGERTYCGATVVVECTNSVPEIICEAGAPLAATYDELLAK